MRRAVGVSADQIDQARSLFPVIDEVLDRLICQGLVEYRQGRYRPTSRGWLCGNELYQAFFDLTD